MANFDKSLPIGSKKLRLSDDDIRQNMDALEDALIRSGMKFPTGYGVDAGEWLVKTFQKQSSDPATPVADKIKFYVKTVGSVIRAFIRDPAGTIRQIGTLGEIDHGADLIGLSDDDHPQYLNLTKAGQTITENLTITALKTVDGRDLSVDGAKIDLLPTLKFLAAPVSKFTWIAFTDWTDVNISADTGTDTAKAALIVLDLWGEGPVGSARFQNVVGQARKNGSSETQTLPLVRLRSGRSASSYCFGSNSCMAIVEVDGSEIFEARLLNAENGADLSTELVFNCHLMGYFV